MCVYVCVCVEAVTYLLCSELQQEQCLRCRGRVFVIPGREDFQDSLRKVQCLHQNYSSCFSSSSSSSIVSLMLERVVLIMCLGCIILISV